MGASKTSICRAFPDDDDDDDKGDHDRDDDDHDDDHDDDEQDATPSKDSKAKQEMRT